MSLFRKIENLKAQIVETKQLLETVMDHPLMSEGFSKRLYLLNQELENLPKESFEPKVELLFSGNAVVGSLGIKTSFITKTITPFQEMVKTQIALSRFGGVGKRGKTRKSSSANLYLTALPTGSFGVELSQLNNDELFGSFEVSNAIKEVIKLVANSSIDDVTFEASIEKTPKRNLENLKKFLQEISEERSILKMESGELGVELSKEQISDAYNRVASTVDEESELVFNGIFRGLLLDSGKFDIQDESGKRISGFISENLNEESLVQYDQLYLNKKCSIHLKMHKTIFKTGNVKIDYELLEIKNENIL